MATEAAVSGLGVILESELLAGQELNDGRLIAPFNDSGLEVESVSYFLVKTAAYHLARLKRTLPRSPYSYSEELSANQVPRV